MANRLLSRKVNECNTSKALRSATVIRLRQAGLQFLSSLLASSYFALCAEEGQHVERAVLRTVTKAVSCRSEVPVRLRLVVHQTHTVRCLIHGPRQEAPSLCMTCRTNETLTTGIHEEALCSWLVLCFLAPLSCIDGCEPAYVASFELLCASIVALRYRTLNDRETAILQSKELPLGARQCTSLLPQG